jgi:trimethylguanosine synthase
MGATGGGMNTANATSVRVAAEIAAAAAAERNQQKSKKKKRGGKGSQEQHKIKRLLQRAGKAAALVRGTRSSTAADGEGDLSADAAAAAAAASPTDGAVDVELDTSAAAAGAADEPAAAEAGEGYYEAEEEEEQQQLVSHKNKKKKLGKQQREYLAARAAAQAELAAAAAAHGTEVRYYAQRYAYFSLWDSGCALDSVGWFSVTPEAIAIHHAQRLRCDVVVDAFAGLGGNAIQLAFTCRHVIAIELDPARLALARRNARVYGVEHLIEWICGDALTLLPGLKADAILLAPPWGGTNYISSDSFDIDAQIREAMGGACGGYEILQRARAVTDNVAFCLPRNCRPEQVAHMASLPALSRSGEVLPSSDPKSAPSAAAELEENRVGGKVKMLTAYFGAALVRNEQTWAAERARLEAEAAEAEAEQQQQQQMEYHQQD